MIATYTIEGRKVWQNNKTRIVTNAAGAFCQYQRQTFKNGAWHNSYNGDAERTIKAVEEALAA